MKFIIRLACFLIVAAVVGSPAAESKITRQGLATDHGKIGAGEGPAWHGDGYLLFTDGGRITKRDASGTVSVFREDAGGANGLLFNDEGRFIVCESGRRRAPALEIGARENPIPATIRLVYFEGMDTHTLPAIVNCEGRRDLHGAPMNRTWVKLAATAPRGGARLEVNDNGETASVLINGQPAKFISSHAGVVDWEIGVPNPRDGKLLAKAVDTAGNTEQTKQQVEVKEFRAKS